MANGGKRVVLNTRERVISNDHNRLQDMIAQSRATALARLYNDEYNADAPGYGERTIVGGQTPMHADVFGGLFVRVDDTTSLFIDPGVVGVVDPEQTPGLDDDPYKVIDDPGLETAGVLTWQANGGGSPRIDLVCADVVDQVLETDNRDIFDTATGLFTPQQVNKVVAKRLVYEIVRGNQGAGIPPIPNRIVLAVASVPPGSSNWQDVTFWDVRPLVADRIRPTKTINETQRRYYEYDFRTDSHVHHGYAYSEYRGYLVGGRLMAAVPGPGDVEFNANSSDNSTIGDTYQGPLSGTSDVGANPVFLLFPAGLPRWARYSEGNAPGLGIRAPYGTRGILVAGRARAGTADYAKADEDGLATGVELPASTGLGGTADGVLLHMLHIESSGGGGVSAVNTIGIGRHITFSEEVVQGGGTRRVVHTVPSGDITAGDTFITHDVEVDWWNNGEIGVPRCAKSVRFRWAPPDLRVSPGTPAPNGLYQQIGLFAFQEGRFWGGAWGWMGLGDGSIVPNPGAEGPSITIPFDRSVTPVQIRVGVNQAAGSADVWSSPWQFDGNGTSRILVQGYEM